MFSHADGTLTTSLPPDVLKSLESMVTGASEVLTSLGMAHAENLKIIPGVRDITFTFTNRTPNRADYTRATVTVSRSDYRYMDYKKREVLPYYTFRLNLEHIYP